MKGKIVKGISARNVRNVELNLQRWLEIRPMTNEERQLRNRTVSLVRGYVSKWRAAIRRDRKIKKRHLRSERAKIRRRSR